MVSGMPNLSLESLGLVPECFFDHFGRGGLGIDGDRRRSEEEYSIADSLLVTVDSPASARQKVDYALGVFVVEHVEIEEDRLTVSQMLDDVDRFFKLTRLDDEHFGYGLSIWVLEHFGTMIGGNRRLMSDALDRFLYYRIECQLSICSVNVIGSLEEIFEVFPLVVICGAKPETFELLYDAAAHYFPPYPSVAPCVIKTETLFPKSNKQRE